MAHLLLKNMSGTAHTTYALSMPASLHDCGDSLGWLPHTGIYTTDVWNSGYSLSSKLIAGTRLPFLKPFTRSSSGPGVCCASHLHTAAVDVCSPSAMLAYLCFITSWLTASRARQQFQHSSSPSELHLFQTELWPHFLCLPQSCNLCSNTQNLFSNEHYSAELSILRLFS